MNEQIYRCESCGGVMEFDAATQTLRCPHCDTQVVINNNAQDIVEHSFTARVAKSYSVPEETSSTMKCSGCGAVIEVQGSDTAAVCPYCGSSYVLADKQEAAIIPDGVIPFKIDNNRVKEIFNGWIKKRRFAPSNLKNLYQSGSIQGRYIPFWTFDADCVATYTGMGGKDRTVRYKDSDGNDRTKTETDWYYTRGTINHFFNDVLIKGTDNYKSSLVNGIDTYNTKDVVSYSPQYFSGYLSETYTVDLETAHKTAVTQMHRTLTNMAEDDIRKRYDRAKDVRLGVSYRDETYKHIMVPMYATSYSYNNTNYTVLINGQNGQIKGSYPKSKAKIGAIVGIILAIIIGVIVAGMASGGKKVGSEMPQYDYAYEQCVEYVADNIPDEEPVEYMWYEADDSGMINEYDNLEVSDGFI